MAEIPLRPEEIHLLMSVIAKAVELIDGQMNPERTDLEMMILAREKRRYEILYDKLARALLSE